MRLTTLEPVPMSKDCSKCGTPNVGDARFCRACGAALSVATAVPAEPPVACRVCGHPNLAGTRFCAQCGSDQATPSAPLAAPAATPPDPRRPMGLWIGLGAVVVALTAGGAWWMNPARAPATPALDAAAPPSTADASRPSAPASASASIEAPLTVLPATAPAAIASAPDEPSEKEQQAAKAKALHDAQAKALREQRQLAQSQAEAELARRRAEEARPHPVPAVPGPRAAAPLPAPPEQPRSVQERCAGRNPVLQGLCEARECIRKENASDAVCQRIRADAEQRRQQN
jgi:hypothetical protein